MKFTICLAAGVLLAGSAHAATNLVVNGDFESGNTGFASDHTYVAPAAGALYPEGLYTIASNPFGVHPYWASLDGSNLMIVNGETGGASPIVWQQSIEVGPGSYDFSAQVANVCCNSSFTGPNAPSNLLFQYSFDGGSTFTSFGNVLTAPPGDAGVFYNLGATIASASAQTLTLRISNDVTAASGNDFAIDNIVLSAIPEPATWAMMIVGMGLAGMSLRRRQAGAMAI